MYTEEFKEASITAKNKINLLENNFIGYFMLSMIAGAFIGIGVLFAFTAGSHLDGQPYAKVVMGIAFGVALSLVVIAGGELFTGNNFVMAAGVLKREISVFQGIKLWIVCFLGNWVGAIVLVCIYHLTGLANGPVGEYMATAALGKMSASFTELVARGILCNILVCLATWCGFRCKSESGKLIMIFWCLFAFITTGFEHSIANMTLFTEAIFNPSGQAVTMAGYLHNLLAVTIGNIIGGVVYVACPYFIASK